MQGFILCVLVALAASQQTSYELSLNPKKTYEYKYEGVINIGRGMPDLAEAGVKLTCTFKITGASAQMFALQISNMAFEEFNGLPGKSGFSASPKLTRRIAAQLTKPFLFEYVKGHIGDIHAALEISDTIVNIVRGILGFLQVTIKTTQKVYELEELGIHGVCQSMYAIEEVESSKELSVTQIIDVSNCREKAAIYRGMALALENKLSKQRGDNIVATAKYIYTVKPTTDGGLITKAYAQERQHFSPFNVKGGNCKLQARKDIVLLRVSDTVVTPVSGPLQSRGNLMYKFGTELKQIPILLKKVDNPVAKIADLIQHLAQANKYQVDSPTSADIVELYQVLRMATLENLETLWKQLSGNVEHRRWFLDTVTEIADERVIQLIKNRFKAGDITANEAGPTILLALNHLTADTELVDMSKEFLTMPFSKSNQLLWSTVVLSYGSLVFRLCAYVQPCPVTAVQPLLDIAANGLTKGVEEEMVLALKALGNAGHPSSIKTIIKFLPGISPKAVDLPTRVLSAAVQSLRHIAPRDPQSVQDIALSLFVQKSLPAEIRMLACMILLETKPPLALVSTVTEFLLEETDIQVASFSYSLLRGLSKSKTPDNHFLSTACNIAVKVLAPKFGRLGYYNSKALHLDWFNDDLLTGTTTEVYMLKNATNVFPTEIMTQGKFHFIGRILQLLELGVRAEGIKQLFGQGIPRIDKNIEVTDFAAIMKILSDWQSLPKDKPLLSAYARAFGQEVFFADLNRDIIQSFIKTLNPIAGKESPVWKMIQDLEKGMSWHWTKPYLVFENRFIQATCIGLPVEISKYILTVTAITVNAKAGINPPLKDRLSELMTSDIALETDGYAGVTTDIFVFHGINTDLFQSGAELQSKTIINMPWKFALKMNVKEKKFEIDVSPVKKVTELFSINFNVYAVSRNIEDPSLAKITPMMPKTTESLENLQIPKQAPVCSGQEQIGRSDLYLPKSCAESTVYGTAICIESEAKRVHYIDEYPLYYFLGYSHFAYTLEPAKTSKPVDRIQIQINVGPHKDIPNFGQMLDIIRRITQNSAASLSSSSSNRRSHRSIEMLDATPDPVVSIRALAMSGGAKPDGYQAVAYYIPAVQKDDIELIVAQVGEEANWKLCTDADVDKIHGAAKIHFRWGPECQSYEMTLKAANIHLPGSKPTVLVKLHWDSVPAYLKDIGKSIEEYVPGVSFLLGFYQKHETNTVHQVSASMVATSKDGFDIKVKMPELTVYRQAIPFPFKTAEGRSNSSLACMN